MAAKPKSTTFIHKNVNWGTIVAVFQIVFSVIVTVFAAYLGLWVRGIDLKYEIRTKVVIAEELEKYDKKLPSTYFSYTEGKLLHQKVETLVSQVKTLGDEMGGMNDLQGSMLEILREISSKQTQTALSSKE